MLVSVAGGQMDPWAMPQLIRLIAGLCLMSIIAFVPIRVFQRLSVAAYLSALALLVAVAFVGETGMGARRWIEIGPFRAQPSELMKVTLVMILAWYYDSLPPERASRPLWILPPVILTVVPAILVFRQPDLGTATLILMGGAVMMFIAGVAWQYFVAGAGLVIGSIATVFLTRGTDFQFLEDYQYLRIETFLKSVVGPAGRRLSHHAVDDRARVRRCFGTRVHAGHPKPSQFSCPKNTPTSSLRRLSRKWVSRVELFLRSDTA